MYRAHLHRIELSPDEQPISERLRRHVDVLASLIGPRHWWRYDMLMAAQRYVDTQLALSGLPVERQTYEVMGRPVSNLIIEQRGQRKPEQILVLGAHYDTVDTTPGADDNASAVAGLLEIAHQLSRLRFKRTIRYVAFVNEEPPFYKSENMGSLRYARRCWKREEKIIGMINLEMIGYYSDAKGSQTYPPLKGLNRVLPSRGNFIVICSDMASARFLSRVAWGFRRTVRFPMLPFPAPRSVSGPDMSDNWSFWQCEYPAVMVTDTSFLRNDNYHKSSDRMETLNFPAMTRVVQGVAGALARIAGWIK
jgi:hypothetical protein